MFGFWFGDGESWWAEAAWAEVGVGLGERLVVGLLGEVLWEEVFLLLLGEVTV